MSLSNMPFDRLERSKRRIATEAVKNTGTSTPVVFVTGDPVGPGFVASLVRPGGAITGRHLVLLEGLEVRTPEDLDRAVATAVRERVGAVMPYSSPPLLDQSAKR